MQSQPKASSINSMKEKAAARMRPIQRRSHAGKYIKETIHNQVTLPSSSKISVRKV